MRSFQSWILHAHLLRLQDTMHGVTHGLVRGLDRTVAGLRKGADDLADTDRFSQLLIHSDDAQAHARIGGQSPDHPRELHAWWSALSDADKDAVYRRNPSIANRNGIPHADRDHYNRRTLDARLSETIATADTTATKNYLKIKKALQQPSGTPRRYLSMLGPRFRVAIAANNPDLSPHVVTFAVGAGVNPITGVVHGVHQRLWRAAKSVDPHAEAAIVVWSGGEGPATVPHAIDSRFARQGAPLLRAFQYGLRVTHHGQRSHNTVIGYSYGSLTAGFAARDGLDADDLVFLGSGGVGVAHTTELELTGVDPADIGKHVYSTVAEYDWIKLMPHPHGPLPTSPEFGATVFTTDSTRGPWNSLGWNYSDHFAYLTHLDNRAMKNLGLVITGLGHLVT
ncbi:alpha/beta hydrolase [Nocardia brasiliensis]|uniref:alpha/beta hydrolase n=1 Tax=Nocardia brasiliensis TaxID=37326 RepID=UPI003D8B50BF